MIDIWFQTGTNTLRVYCKNEVFEAEMDVVGKFSYTKALKAHDLKRTKNIFSRISNEIFELCLNLSLGGKSFSCQVPEKETSSLLCTVVS